MQNSGIAPLVRHTEPKPTESYPGLILRLSEENGYTSIRYLFARAGVGHFSGNPSGIDCKTLKQLTNWKDSKLEKFAYFNAGPQESTCRILEHQILKSEVDLGRAKICPFCVKEKGFIEAHFDLKIMYGCPDHEVELLYDCPKCKEPLSWFRPGLLECRCGASLSETCLPRLATLECEILACIKSKLLGEERHATPKRPRLPAWIHGLGLRATVALVWAFGRLVLQTKRLAKAESTRNIVQRASSVLADWPHQFDALLDGFMENSTRRANPNLSKGPLRHAYNTLLKRRIVFSSRQEEAALREAFERYIVNRPEYCSIVGNRGHYVRGSEKERYITRTEMMRRLGISGKLANRLIEEGMVSVSKIRGAGSQRVRTVIDTEGSEVLQLAKGVVHSKSSAAALIGIPGPVLTDLVRTGDFTIRHPVKQLSTGFHEADLHALRAKILALAPRESTAISGRTGTVSLGHLMGSKCGTGRSKASIIRAILAGEVKILYATNATVDGILLSGRDCEKYTYYWTSRKTISHSMNETADLLGCDVNVIHGLVKLGFLEGHYKGCALRITSASIIKFRREFSFLSSVSQRSGVSPQAMVFRCRAERIELLYVHRSGNGGKQPFINNFDRKRLLDFWLTTHAGTQES